MPKGKNLPVAVVGAGMIRFGELFDKGYEDMVVEAYKNCLKSVDKGIDERNIEAAWLGIAGPGFTMRREVLGSSGLTEPLRFFPRPVTRVENACCSGSDAVRNAAFAVAAGIYDVVLVVGVEKQRNIPSRDSLIAQAAETFHAWWHPRGTTMPQRYAAFATAHMHQFGTTREQMATVAVKNHHNGALNPHAYFRNEITKEQVLNAPTVCWPLGLYDCCPTTDGAAAVILTGNARAKEYTDKPLYFWGTGLATGPFYLPWTSSFLGFPATEAAAKEASAMAGIGPKDIDVAELHDCFTIAELLAYEDLGFCTRGQSGHWLEEGHSFLEGDKPCNTSGGLKAKGHPTGATGVAQVCELWSQLRGEAGKRQVKNASVGLTHNVGGVGTQVMVNIFANELR